MPKIINEFANENPLAVALQGFAGSFGGNTAQTEMYRQKAMGLGRENVNIPLLADAVVGNDPSLTARYGIMSGVDPKVTGGYRQFYGVQKYGPGSAEATRDTMSVPGANYGNTVQGTNAEMANRRGIAQMTTDRTLAADKFKFDNTFETVMDPATNQPTLVPRSQAAGRQPFLPLSQVQGGILQQAIPTLTPEQQAAAGGYAPKNPANVWVYRKPDGSMANTLDGRTDAQTGQPITGPAMKLEGANTEGLSGNNTVDTQINNARIATEQTKALITRIRTGLAQPDSAAALGFLGQGATLFNNLRAQFEATARLVGGTTAAQDFADPGIQQALGQATNFVFGNTGWNARAQQLGIDSGKMRSQIQDLAFAIAKAQDPSGRVSIDDVRRAAETIGASLMDPRAADAVLGDLNDRVEENMAIRERVTRQTFSRMGGAPAPQPGQPAAPAAPPAGGVIRYDAQGNRVQ